MEDFTRKFNAAQDKSVQIHHVLTTVYEALKEKGYDPINQIVVRGPHLHHQPQLRPHPHLQGGSGRAAAGSGEELSGHRLMPLRK